MSQIPHDILVAINLLRREAKEKNEAADVLERLYGAQSSQPKPSTPDMPVSQISGAKEPEGSISLDQLIGYLRKGYGGRVTHIAKHFWVSENKIRSVIESSGGQIKIIERGWVKLAEEPLLQ